jgi:serine/threonine-protein kinase
MSAVVSVEAATPKACPSCGKRYPADALFCSLDGAPLTTSPGAIAAAAASDPYVGREILGHIEIRQLVGIGAMGRVYRAHQKGIERDVAVKILHRELSANPTLVSRFHREAKVASRLAHPNVVHVLLVGQLPDGAMYIVMEYLDGMSLQSALAACGGSMPLPRALHIALQLCDAAGEAHAQGVVHRDIKPENVMLIKRADDPDYVKVLDFGIARLNWGEQSMSTAAGLIFGTARYISPEGAQGERVGPQGDVYSIATMIYQMLAGRAPFDGEQAVALLVQQIHDPPAPLTSMPRAAHVPEPIADVVMANLAKKPADRSENARAFGRALLDAAVASGLGAQDILAGPALIGAGRAPQSSRVQVTDKDVAAAKAVGRVGASRTSHEEPTPHVRGRTMVKTEVPDDQAITPGGPTRKWAPPADFEAKLVPPPPPSTPRVDETMDDQHAVAARVLQAPSAPRTAPPLPPSSEAVPRSAVPTGPPAVPRGSMPSIPGPTLPPAMQPGDAPSMLHGRSFLIVLACFLVGAFAVAALYRAGIFGGASHMSALDTIVARAQDARSHQRWDEPPGDNVRDITDDGLSRWPHEPKIVKVRQQACEDLLKVAQAKHDDGDPATALRYAKLAATLDPTSAPARDLVSAWAPPEVRVAANETTVPPLVMSRPATGGASVPAPAAPSGAAAARATLDASTGKPGVGQPVDFTAHVVGGASKGKVEGAKFRIAGPGLSGNELDATEDASGAFRTTFTFMQPGKFDVSFSARADGSPVRSSRAVVVEAGKPSSVSPSASATPSPTSEQPAPPAAKTAPPAAAKTAPPANATPPASGPFI